MKRYILASGLISLVAFATPASAKVLANPVVVSPVVDGACISVLDPQGCLYNGNINSNSTDNKNGYLSAQAAYNLYNNTHPSAGVDILLTVLASTEDKNFSSFGTFTGAGSSSGTWSLPGYAVNFFAVKAADNFLLFELGTPASHGSWSTSGIPFNKNPHDISHLVFFGTRSVTPSAVPEPETWAMMLAGFGLIGFAARRRAKPAVTVTYS